MLHNDSLSAIEYSKDFKFHGKTKHIEIRYYFISNNKDEVRLSYIPIRLVAHPLTNPLALDWFKTRVKAMSLRR